MFFGSEIGTHTHVHHDYFPLRRTVGTGRSDIMTADAIFRPELRAAFPSRPASCSGGNFSGLLIGSATNEPSQGRAKNDYDGPG